MDYIQGLNVQTQIFFYSLGFGFLLGILYDVFRTVRIIITDSRGFIIAMDIAYFAVCSFLVFCFNLVVDNGKVRIYIIFGEILGWLIYYFSFGAVAIRVSNEVKKFFRKVIISPAGKLVSLTKRKNSRFAEKTQKLLKKYNKKIKFCLQKHKGIVYNLNSYNEK